MENLNDIKKELIEGTLREGDTIQIKPRLQRGNEDQLARLLAALSNTYGGYLIIGVQENENRCEIIGLAETKNELEVYFDTTIYKYTTGVEYSLHIENIEGKNIAIVAIMLSNSTVYFSRRDTSPERQIAYVMVGTKIQTVGRMLYKRVFKYMTVEDFLLSLYSRSWRFQEPSKWDDKFEQRFYCANYKIAGAAGNTPQLFATCVTRAKNSEAAWKVYAHGQGLGAHCLQLEIDIAELRQQLRASKLKIVEKQVEYKDERYILELHKKRSKNYSKYFGSFTFDKFIELLTLKREAYTYEQEVRLFVIPDMTVSTRNKWKKALSRDMPIDWRKVIKSVRIDKNCSAGELKAIEQACFSVGITPVFKSTIVSGGMSTPAGSVRIDFDSFDIDDMPGNSGITVK